VTTEGVLATTAATLSQAVADLGAAGEVLASDAAGQAWRGPAASAAAARRAALRQDGRALEEDVRRVVAALEEAAWQVARLEEATRQVARLEVPAALVPASGPVGPTAAVVTAAVLDAALRAVDERLAARLDAAGAVGRAGDAADGGTETAGAAVLPPPGPPALDPNTVAAWWSGLDEPTRASLRTDRPDLVGGLDGIPARDRDAANRARLAIAREATEAERGALLASVAGAAGTPVGLAALGVRLTEVGRRLDRLIAVSDAAARPGRALLALDTSGGGVRAAVAQGDVDTARNVGVFTPGFTADVRDLDGRLADLGRVRALAGPDTAMVAWYDYDAPQWSGLADPNASVAAPGPARDGAVRLSRFFGGLDAVRDDDAHVTAIGHSYGSLTTALAVEQSPGVDDAVYLGSPGLGGTPRGARAWVGEAAGDPVADAGWFGPDPNRVPGVVGLSTREAVLPDGTVLDGSTGHDEYLRAGSTSEHNVAAVVGGRPADALLDRGVGVGDRLRGLLGG